MTGPTLHQHLLMCSLCCMSRGLYNFCGLPSSSSLKHANTRRDGEKKWQGVLRLSPACSIAGIVVGQQMITGEAPIRSLVRPPPKFSLLRLR
eukprot:2840865-Amphidinium_carterae.1